MAVPAIRLSTVVFLVAGLPLPGSDARAQDPGLERRAARALRQGGRAWERFLVEQRARPEGVARLASVLARQQSGIIDQLEPLRERVEQLSVVRRHLDAARARALELIFDEETYFYPYDAAQVGAELAAKYAEVQREVDQRVALVRELWNSRQASHRLTGTRHLQLQRLRSVREALAEFAAGELELDPEDAWVLTLPESRHLTVQSFCVDAEERERLDLGRRIEEFNETVGVSLAPAERELVSATNGYRSMFGRLPLALNPKLVSAARSHARDMSESGYFSHSSPRPERSKPRDRAVLVGYQRWRGENLSFGMSSALDVLEGWIRSSIHHRNLLDEKTSELGIGNSGHYWVQEFGNGKEYRQHADFPRRSDR